MAKVAFASPAVTSVRALAGAAKPVRVKITGENFLPGLEVFVGEDKAPWPNVTRRGTTMLILKGGRSLKERFRRGVAVPIRLVNPDGGEVTTVFTR